MGNVAVVGDRAQITTPQRFFSNAARFLSGGLNINALRTNDLLRKEEWVELDRAVVEVARQRLVGIADLRARNLIHPLGGLGTILSQYEQQSDMTDADVDMAGVTRGEEDAVEFNLVSVPIPIVHKDFRVNIRRLEASRRLGDGIDTTQAQVASRKVADGLESMLFNGVGVTVDGKAIYGYTTHPDRNTGVATGDWGTITNIYSTILDMVKMAQADQYFGPYGVYVSGNQWTEMFAVYTDGSGQTALDRVLRLPQIEFVKPADALADGNVILVQLSRDVVDLAIAQDVVTIEWETQGGMISHFKVFAAMAPRVKSDDNGSSGVVHYTGA